MIASISESKGLACAVVGRETSEGRRWSFSVGALEFSVSRDGLSAKGEDLVVTVKPFSFSSTVTAAMVDDAW